MSSIANLNPFGLRQQFQLDTFVETGCYQGESLALAHAAGYAKLISCDINPECVAACRGRFPQAKILHTESTAMLELCLPLLPAAQTLFWLDAHFAGHYGLPETPENRYPLVEELRLIRGRKCGWERDVIAIDDLRIIRDPQNPRWRQGELSGPDAALCVDITLAELFQPFAATHSLRLIHADEGSMLFLPKL